MGRRLIVNADDFGLTSGVNRGIVEAHQAGIVTSASLMVYGGGAGEAVALARQNPALGIGLHLDLGEWMFQDGEWVVAYERASRDNPLAVARELKFQVGLFADLVGRLPDHIDSHQHLHIGSTVVGAAVAAVAEELDVPVRRRHPGVGYASLYGQDRWGNPYEEGISLPAYIEFIESLPEGATELGCHPGYVDGLKSVYAAEREVELRALCSPEVRQAVAGAELINWGEFGFRSERPAPADYAS